MKNLLQYFFYNKEVSKLDVDSGDLTKNHHEIIKKKKTFKICL